MDLSLAGGIKNFAEIVFGINFYSPGGAAQLSNLEDLSLPLATSTVSIVTDIYDYSNLPAVQFVSANGTITSITAVPEPSGLAIFAALGIAVMVYHPCHESWSLELARGWL